MRLPIAAILLLAATSASAQPPAPSSDGRQSANVQRATIVAEPVALAIAGFDADQDGVVIRAELNAGAARSFASVANGAKDIGYIGYADWALKYLGDANALPSPFEVDGDRDNRITAAELTAALTSAFDRFDKNRDGCLTRAELVTVRATTFGTDRRTPQDKPPRK